MREPVRLTVFVGALVVMALLSSGAGATPVMFRYSVEVTDVSDTNGTLAAIVGGLPSPGDVILGRYTFDSLAPNTGPDADTAIYWNYGPPYSFDVTILAHTFQDSAFIILVENDEPTGLDVSDAYGVQSWIDADGVSFGFSMTNVSTAPASPLGSTDLPLSPPSVSDFPSYNFFGIGNYLGADDWHVWGKLTSIAVPEPAAGVLFAIGLGGVLCRQRETTILRIGRNVPIHRHQPCPSGRRTSACHVALREQQQTFHRTCPGLTGRIEEAFGEDDQEVPWAPAGKKRSSTE